jgi:hypothetical protein
MREIASSSSSSLSNSSSSRGGGHLAITHPREQDLCDEHAWHGYPAV